MASAKDQFPVRMSTKLLSVYKRTIIISPFSHIYSLFSVCLTILQVAPQTVTSNFRMNNE